jgi:hypothetical protein
MLVIPHRFKKIGLHNVAVRRIFSDILLVLGLKKFEKHCARVTYPPTWGRYTTICNGNIVDTYLKKIIRMQIVKV